MEGKGFKAGDKLTLYGKVKAGQDHGYHEFDFGLQGKEFEVSSLLPDNRLELMADGYGDQSRIYGNGRLFVTYEVARKASIPPAAAQPEKEGWRPKAGDDVRLRTSSKERLHVHATCGDVLWCEDGDHVFTTRITLEVERLPAEPPVKVGDIIEVARDETHKYYGPVVKVEAADGHFQIRWGTTDCGFDWDCVKITHLQPVEHS